MERVRLLSSPTQIALRGELVCETDDHLLQIIASSDNIDIRLSEKRDYLRLAVLNKYLRANSEALFRMLHLIGLSDAAVTVSISDVPIIKVAGGLRRLMPLSLLLNVDVRSLLAVLVRQRLINLRRGRDKAASANT